jgi:hypothetical protein
MSHAPWVADDGIVLLPAKSGASPPKTDKPEGPES